LSIILCRSITLLSCQNLLISIFAENDFLIAQFTVVRISSKYDTPKPIRTDLKSGSNSCKPPIYDILRDKKFKSPFLTFHPENITMILYMQKDLFSVQTISCIPRVFCPSRLKQLHTTCKSSFINCFKTWG